MYTILLRNSIKMPKKQTSSKKKWICSGDIPEYIVETIKSVPFALEKVDPGIFIAFSDDETIHEALSFDGPLPLGSTQQATPEASAAHFKNW